MDGSMQAIFAEMIKLGLGVYLLVSYGNSWFGLEKVLSFGNTLIIAYLILSIVLTIYFYLADRPVEEDVRDDMLVIG